MANGVRHLSIAQARRIALAAQGFADKRPGGRVDARHFRRVMDRMAVLQLDSVNVLCRSHFLPVLARLGPYDRDALDRYLYHSGEHYEFLAHEASLTSQDHQPLLRHRRRGWAGLVELRSDHPDYVDAIHAEVAERGPISVRDLQDPGGRSGPWWGWSKGKVALEALYTSGELSIHERDRSFVTHYDLPERVIRPDVLERPTPDDDEAKRALVLRGLQSHGVGTAADVADYFRLKVTETKRHLADLVAEGRVEPVAVEGWSEPAFADPGARKPRAVPGRALLSPFDPIVWFRPRAERLWGFHYRIEIYVPAPKRVYGYYVLPFLLDEELVARVDLKADRGDGVLRVRASHLEAGHDDLLVAEELAGALTEMAGWLDLDEVAVEDRGDLAPTLARVVT